MKQGSRFRPSPSLVISCISLFVALSGTAVALTGKNTVDSGDIKPHTIQKSDMAPLSVGVNQIGAHTIIGANINDATIYSRKLVGTHVVQNSSFVGEFTTIHAQCPENEILLSGGVQADSGGTTEILASGPDLSADAPRTWFAQLSATNASHFGSATVFAVCLS